jgi:hypothetical protein
MNDLHLEKMMKAGTFLLAMAVSATSAHAADLALLQDPPRPGGFDLVNDGKAAELYYDGTDFEVVEIAANLLAEDLARVSSVKPAVRKAGAAVRPVAGSVIIGTLGKSPAIDELVKAGNLDVSPIKDKWESFIITTAQIPGEGGEPCLIIAGADRRGTAYGAMELSRAAGVSPFIWWADVLPPQRTTIQIRPGIHVQGPPSVKFRGIFINDEDWGLQPWAAKTVEPELGDIGPKTYTRVFELLLRLRANFCWPAMHDCTKAFNIYPENKLVADRYAIVMGSSHCEPMLRNNVTEWGNARARDYNYVTNRQGVLDYWKQRVAENGKFENVYTLGMRGIHDSDMAGGGTRDERVARLSAIINDQREMIRELITPQVSTVPQIFCPYKEVLSLYQAGAVPPDDVTIVWADDNHGYIRQLSTPQEQKRAGGAGVYYHLSYWGRPHDYLWLSTTPPSLVWQEMSKAYDYGARNLWVMNVGDIKPAEIGLTLAMSMAYDMSAHTLDNIGQFPEQFAAATFGTQHAREIAAVLQAFYQLNYQRKPEHLGFNTSQNPGGPIQPTGFTNAEIHARLAAFDALRAQADRLYETLPPAQKDAFYQLVLYPVRGATLQNHKLLWLDLHRRAGASGDATAAQAAAARSKAAYEAILAETNYYNTTLAGGKWRHMMSSIPHNTDVHKAPRFNEPAPPNPAAAVPDFPVAQPAPLAPVPAYQAQAAPSYAEHGGYLSIPAERFTRKTDRGNIAWKTIPNLGRLGDSMAIYPTTAPSIEPAALLREAPALEYDFTATSSAPAAALTVQAIPAHRIHPGRGLRYAIAIDNEVPQLIDLETPENSAIWATNVLRGAAYGTTTHPVSPGKHTLRIWMVDPGVIIDHLTVNLGGLPNSYLPPAETLSQ